MSRDNESQRDRGVSRGIQAAGAALVALLLAFTVQSVPAAAASRHLPDASSIGRVIGHGRAWTSTSGPHWMRNVVKVSKSGCASTRPYRRAARSTVREYRARYTDDWRTIGGNSRIPTVAVVVHRFRTKSAARRAMRQSRWIARNCGTTVEQDCFTACDGYYSFTRSRQPHTRLGSESVAWAESEWWNVARKRRVFDIRKGRVILHVAISNGGGETYSPDMTTYPSRKRSYRVARLVARTW